MTIIFSFFLVVAGIISPITTEEEISSSPPHIVFILADDLGWGDVGFTQSNSSIPTPRLDKLSREGIILSQHHVPSTCTPSRASLMSGRYPANVGLAFAMLPGSLAGLPLDMPTLPQLLRKKGYSAHMVGKWHLGMSTWEQTPVGRGFQTHVGSYLWSMSYDSKGLWELPWKFSALDWVRASENGTYTHYSERRHTTEVLTEEALRVISSHKTEESPLFLYLPFTAPHVPLEPLEEDLANCRHLNHPWRVSFCGLVQGLDRSVEKVVQAAKDKLGENTVIVFTSDNGGALWFGGNNEPLRSGKTMAFQGGVRVPTFVLDLSHDKRYFGKGGRQWDGLSHMSDWLPTFLSLGSDSSLLGVSPPNGIDGFDLSSALKQDVSSPRKNVLLEMYYGSLGEFLFPEDVAAYRKGKYKLIEAKGLRDTHWYKEPDNGLLNFDGYSWFYWFCEMSLRVMESFTDPGRFEALKDIVVHVLVQEWMRENEESLYLFDLDADPEEKQNLAKELPHIVADLQRDVIAIRDARPPQQEWWMTIDRELEWKDTLEQGDCSNSPEIEAANECWFAHPWIKTQEQKEQAEARLVNGASFWPFIKAFLFKAFEIIFFPTLVLLWLLFTFR